MRNSNKITLAIIVLTCSLLACKSAPKTNIVKEENASSDSLANYPYWIDLMNKPGVNYDAAVAAFNAYWANREKPTEADGEGIAIFESEKEREQAKEKAKPKSIELVYEYKQFINWQIRNKDLLKADGTVLTPEEIMLQSQKERGLK